MANSIKVGDKEYALDEEGFLADPNTWNEELAVALAKQFEGVEEMTDDHWKLVRYIREYFDRLGIAPPIRKLSKDTGFSQKEIYMKFPSGPAKGVCRVAGLPKPTGCV